MSKITDLEACPAYFRHLTNDVCACRLYKNQLDDKAADSSELRI